jgi:hypothetical protein
VTARRAELGPIPGRSSLISLFSFLQRGRELSLRHQGEKSEQTRQIMGDSSSSPRVINRHGTSMSCTATTGIDSTFIRKRSVLHPKSRAPHPNTPLVGVMPRHKGRAMPIYRCYFLDSADHIVMSEMVNCEDNAMAKQRAHQLLGRAHPFGGRAHSAIEMWLGPRRVYRTPAPMLH